MNKSFHYPTNLATENISVCCLAFDWSSAAWPIWWFKQSIKLCKVNESVAAMTNTSCIYLLTCVSVICFLQVQKFILSFTLPLYYTKGTRRRVVLVSMHLNLHQVIETYIKDTSWKRCYLVTSYRLIHVYFAIQESFLLI